MIFEGNNNRKFTEQKSASFLLSDSVVDNVTGEAYFGFSGESQSLQWKFKKGKIYDPDNNYIFSYSPSQSFTLSGDISEDYYNYSINGTSIARGRDKNNFKLENFFVNTTDCSLNTSLSIYSDGIDYTFALPESMILGENVTAQITNDSTDSKLYIFDVTLKNTTNTNYTLVSFPDYISSYQTEDFVFTNVAGNPGQHSFDIDLNTNIGNISIRDSILTSAPEVVFVVNKLEVSGEDQALTFSGYGPAAESTEGIASYKYTSFIQSISNPPQEVLVSLEYAGGNVGTYHRVTGVNVTEAGEGYLSDATITFDAGQENEVQAEGSVTMNGDKVSEVTITNSGIYYEVAPSVSFSGASTNGTDAQGYALTETYEKTFSECFNIYAGLSLGNTTDEDFESGNYGDMQYDYLNLGPGIYTNPNLVSLASEEPLHIRIKGKSFYDFDEIKAKLKVTGTLEDSNTNRLLEETTISSQNTITGT